MKSFVKYKKSFGYAFVVYVFLIVSVLLAFLFNANWRLLVGSDFLNYFVAANIIRRGDGYRLYNPDYNYKVQKELTKLPQSYNTNSFRSLPLSALLLLPLSGFEAIHSFRLFVLVNILLSLLIMYIALKEFSNIQKYRSYLILLFFLYFPVLSAFQMGQISLFLGLISMLVYHFLKRGKEFWVGILASFLLIKIQYIIFVPFVFFLVRNKKGFVFSFLGASMVLIALCISIVGWKAFFLYPSYLLNTESGAWGSRANEIFTFYAVLTRMKLPQIFHINMSLAINFVLYLITLTVFAGHHKKATFDSLYIAALLFTIFFSVHSLAYDLIFMSPFFYILLNRLIQKGHLIVNRELIIAGILFLLPGVVVLGDTFFIQILFLFAGLYFVGIKINLRSLQNQATYD